MEINKIENKNINAKSTIFKCIALINWLDPKLELNPPYHQHIKKNWLLFFFSMKKAVYSIND